VKVTLEDIRGKFNALENGEESREEIANFAIQAIKADDAQSLEMESNFSDKIWKAIIYLSGVDLKDSPDAYFHSIANFVEFRGRLGI
jgi:adenylyl- and sulfurtransferase ThiI